MKLTYDPMVDALYIQFKETTVTTQHITESISLDYDSEGFLVGIEILDAIAHVNDPMVFKQGENLGMAHTPSQ